MGLQKSKLIASLLENIEEGTEQGHSRLDTQEFVEYLETYYPPHVGWGNLGVAYVESF